VALPLAHPSLEELRDRPLTLDLGSANLPLNVFARLLHLGKVAVSLCGDCSVGLEGEEPVLANQGRSTVDNCSA
jgi:hypothetical protein